MKKFTRLLSVALLSMMATVVSAQLSELTEGAVYHFQNAGDATKALYANSDTDVSITAVDKTNKNQQWYVTKAGDYYVFRNLSNGKYLKGNGQNGYWNLSDAYTVAANKFTIETSAATGKTDKNTIKTNGTDEYGYMHYGSWHGDIIGWTNDAENSAWDITEVAYEPEELESLLDAFIPVETIKLALAAIFSDGACTTLNDAYTSANMTDATLEVDANYNNLPSALKKVVKKVRSNNWAEDNGDATLAAAGKNWDSEYGKKFRVQMYEPYSIGGDITSFLRINAHCNMDNPTGIYADNGDVIYIMVEEEPADGAELWVAHQTGFGACNDYNNSAYTQLHQGLNVVSYTADGSCLWINYVVDTYNADGTTDEERFQHKISDFNPIKIQIAGGHINGFFNAIGDFRTSDTGTENLWGDVDNDDDWDYYKERAPLNGTNGPNRDFPLLGHRQTLLFPLGQQANAEGGMENGLLYHLDNITVLDTPNCYGGSGNTFGTYADQYSGMGLDKDNGKINIMIEAWDRIMYSELATLGLVSTATINKMNALYPRWENGTTPAEIYNYGSATVNNNTKTYLEFCEGIDYSEYFNHHGCGVGANNGYMSGGWLVCNYHYNTMGSIIGKIPAETGPTWGPAHEIGHQHQAVFNLNGQTEITNNFFSNVAVWYMGMGTSRVNGSSGSLENLLTLFNNDEENQYSKMTQDDNIWTFTQLYYRLWLYYHLAGNNTQFWPRLFELCRREPLENSTQISGETSTLLFYKHACEAAGEDLTEFFRAHGYFDVMDNVFVDDYTGAIYNVTQEQIDAAIAEVKAEGYPENLALLFINDATGNNTVKHDGTTLRDLWDDNPSAEMGSVNDFITGNAEVTETYTATYNSDGTITMSGGTGGVGFLVLNEKGEIVSFSNNATFALSNKAKEAIISGKATIVAIDGENMTTEAEVDLVSIKYDILGTLLAEVKPIIDKIDDTHTKVGYYKGALYANLKTAYNNATTVYESGAGYEGAYELLYTEYTKVKDNPDAKIPLISGAKYAIKNKGGNDYMTISDVNELKTTNSSTLPTTDDALWVINIVGETYSIKHAGTNKYLQQLTGTDNDAVDVGDTEISEYKITEMSDDVGFYALSTVTYPNRYLNRYNASKVAEWGGTDANSRWSLTLVDDNAKQLVADLSSLQNLMAKTEALIDGVANVNYKGDMYPLQADEAGEPFYITSNATENGNGPKNLLDNNTGSKFHTQWYTGDPQEYHYLQIDMGDVDKAEQFILNYTTINAGNVDAPTAITVYGSNDANFTNATTLATLSSGDANPLPTELEKDYRSAVLGTSGNQYRYLRFTVTDATGGTLGNYHYFGLSELSIERQVAKFHNVYDKYSEYITSDAVTEAMSALQDAKDLLNGSTITTETINPIKTALETKYNTLLGQYNIEISTRKATLLELVTETEALITEAAKTLEFDVATPLSLTINNLYCNDPHLKPTETSHGDHSADYVNKLTDNDVATYLHTDYADSNTGSLPHYLRVDLGEDATVKNFKFNYTTRDNGNNCPTTIAVEGSNDAEFTSYETLKTLTTADGLPNGDGEALSFESKVIANTGNYRYIRFKVTGVEGGTSPTYFVMSEFGFSTVADDVSVKDKYAEYVSKELLLNTYFVKEASENMAETTLNVTIEMLDAQIADLTTAKTALEAEIDKASVDKTELQTAYDEALLDYNTAKTLYDKMAENGTVNSDYAPSTLTNAQLAAAKTALDELKTALDAAQTALEATTITQDEVDAAKTTLQEKNTALETPYGVLLAVETANNATAEQRTTLNELVSAAGDLLDKIAETGEMKNAIALQATNEDNEFYIWCNAPADDSNGVAGILDDDISTFLGSDYGNVVAAYTHYLEVDLGVATTIDNLSFDYTTRNSDLANQRPTAIKILGSNNKVDYTEITTINEGLATEAAEEWSMASPLELGARYRYVRFAFATDEETGYFNLSEFDLYSTHDKAIKEYYTTADIDLGALLLALEVATDAVARHYLTAEQYTNIYNKLNTLCTSANEKVALDHADRDALAQPIEDTQALVDKVATVTAIEEEVALQCADATAPYYIYCNAPGANNGSENSGDRGGVACLIDKKNDGTADTGTFLHTSYGGANQDDNLDHYLRVDMGEGSNVVAFKFSYVGRMANSNNAPTTMVIEGCDEVNGEYEPIITLTDLPTDKVPAKYSSELIIMPKAYRYIRFMVTDTKNHATTTYNDIEHKFFVMSHFSLTSCIEVELKEAYKQHLQASLVATAYNERAEALYVKEHYAVEATVTTALDELQAAYAALAAGMIDRTALQELIAATDALEAELYTKTITSYNTSEEVTLQCDSESEAGYIYCNAPEESSTWGTDNAGVAGAIDLTDGGDPNLETYLHTEWTGENSADGLDHYLRVDLGADAAVDYLEFGYVGRSGHYAKTPKTIVVEACNDLNAGTWTEITTLKNLTQPSDATEIKSGCLGNGTAYRYWRFMVTESNGGGKAAGHPYFVLTNFKVYRCTDIVIEETYKYSPTIYIHTTTDLVAEVEAALTEARSLVDEAASQDEVDTGVDALQAVYDKLAEALKFARYKVEITTDASAPKLYTIYSQRGDAKTSDAWTQNNAKCWQYNIANNNVTINAVAADNLCQLWYFTAADIDDEENNSVNIVPVMTPAYGLGANNFDNGEAKISAINPDDASGYVTSWTIHTSATTANEGAAAYYNFKPLGKSTYLSNYNGGSKALGFYTSEDEGSRVYFTKADVDSYAKKRLQALADLTGGNRPVNENNAIGCYSKETATDYNEAYDAAAGLLADDSTTDAALFAGFEPLWDTYNALERNMPVEGGFYRIRSACTDDYCSGQIVYVNDANGMQFADYDETSSRAIWYITPVDGGYNISSLHTGGAVGSLGWGASHTLGAESKKITIDVLNEETGELKLNSEGGYPMHAQNDNDVIVGYPGDAGSASAWYIEEVDVKTDVQQSISLNTARGDENSYSTFYSAYPVTLPDGVNASIITARDADNGRLTMEPVTTDDGNRVVPAYTAVILTSTCEAASTTSTSSAVNYAGDNAAVAVSTDGNMLNGTLTTEYIDCTADDATLYSLGRKNNRVAMYRAYKNYEKVTADNGKVTYNKLDASSDAGGYVKLGANKAYLLLSGANASNISMFGFWFGGGTTDIEGVEAEGNLLLDGTIYDLQGRKLERVSAPGLYIVNGKKVYISEVE